jgi:hypothetical protein
MTEQVQHLRMVQNTYRPVGKRSVMAVRPRLRDLDPGNPATRRGVLKEAGTCTAS